MEYVSKRFACRDPFIMLHEGTYYLYKNNASVLNDGIADAILCYTSADLEEWNGPYTVFKKPENFHGIKHTFWAPECHYYNGAFYIFTSVYSSKTNMHAIATYKADNPLGPFYDISNGFTTKEDWCTIDGTLYVDEENQPWLVFVHEWWTMPDNNGSIACARLSPDLSKTISEPITLFYAKDPPWATRGVTDGPFVYKSNGKLSMIWSNFGEKGYVIALATSSNGKLNGKWTHNEKLLYEKDLRKEFTTDGGHGMIFKAKDGSLKLTFHAPETTKTATNFEHVKIYDLIDKDGVLEIAPSK